MEARRIHEAYFRKAASNINSFIIPSQMKQCRRSIPGPTANPRTTYHGGGMSGNLWWNLADSQFCSVLDFLEVIKFIV